MFYAVIMAGGSGTRLWPLSRRGRPKQTLQLIGDRTMFQHAVDRLAPLFPPERIYVVTNAAMAELLRPQAPDLPAGNFIIEPEGRDSAPAAGLAAVHLLHLDPDATMVTLTADHYIVDTAQFRSALVAAEEGTRDGTIVTLGIQPTYASTGFGYIELAGAQTIINGFRLYGSARFIEKPDRQTAVRFVEGGRHLWNSGMFVWRADRLMAEFATQLPDLYGALRQVGEALELGSADQALSKVWTALPKVSIDYGVMEHAERVAVIPVDIGWSDIGSWSSLVDVLDGDAHGNVVDGELIALDTSGCLVRSREGRLVAAIGLQGMVIVDTPDVVLVCPQSRAQDVRDIVNMLAQAHRFAYL